MSTAGADFDGGGDMGGSAEETAAETGGGEDFA